MSEGDYQATVEEVLEVIEGIPEAVDEYQQWVDEEWWEEQERLREQAAVQWLLDEAQRRRQALWAPREE